MAESAEPHKPTAPLAAALAVLNVVFAKILFGLAYAGPAASFLGPLSPFLSGGVGVYAAWYAVQAWRANKADASGASAVMLTVAFVALLADLIVVGFALVMLLMVIHGPIVQ